MISRQILFALMLLLAPLTHAQIPLPGLNSGVPKAEAELAPVDSDPRTPRPNSPKRVVNRRRDNCRRAARQA